MKADEKVEKNSNDLPRQKVLESLTRKRAVCSRLFVYVGRQHFSR
jgi:hypothetical protein